MHNVLTIAANKTGEAANSKDHVSRPLSLYLLITQKSEILDPPRGNCCVTVAHVANQDIIVIERIIIKEK